MTRIISGRFRGVTLQVPKKGTRPTSDRVRESLFQILSGENIFSGAKVLDLYAGSGSLGFEALSRGGAELTLVDISAGSIASLTHNRDTVLKRDAGASISVIKKRSTTFLSGIEESTQWDLVFIDPPYDLPQPEIWTVLETLTQHLHDDSIVVLEQSSRSPFLIPEEVLRVFLEREYGDSKVSLLTKVLPLTS